jgi:PAS domain S-box-containing protein
VSDPFLTALELLAGACLMPACVYLWLWIRHGRTREYGWTALLGIGCAGYVTCSVLEYQATSFSSYLLVYRPQPLFTALVPISMMELAYALHPRPSRSLATVVHGLSALLGISGFVRLFDQDWAGHIRGIYQNCLVGGLGHLQLIDRDVNAIGMCIVLSILVAIVVTGWTVHSARRNGADRSQVRFLSWSVVVLFTCYLHDFLAVTCHFPWPYLVEPGFFLISFLLGSSLLRDLLRSQAVQAEGKARQEAFQILFHQNPHACVITKVDDGTILEANQRFSAMFGVPSGNAVLGRTTTDLGMWISPIRRSEFMDTLTSSGAGHLHSEMRRVGGEVFFVSLSIQRISYEGTPALLGLLEDIDQQTRADEALRDSERRYRDLAGDLEHRVEERTSELRESLSEIESFNYMVSHDLRSPLRAIDGFARVLAEDHSHQLDGAGRTAVDRIQQATRRMGELIEDLLFFSHSGRVPLSPSTTDLSAIARETVSRLRESDKSRHVDFSIEDEIVVLADPGLLRSVLENLLDNAWKYTSRNPDARIEVRRQIMSDRDWVCVVDNGIGFDMRYADQLFGTFQRLHGPEFPGTGIGLATVKRIVLRHGGEVAAEGLAGKGATFRFHLGGGATG